MRNRVGAKEADGQQCQKAYGRNKAEKRAWLHIDMHGISQDLEVTKSVIMRQAHLPARDLRVLDPVLSYPSTILGREHAIVVNLEHIKTIITAQEVFLLDASNPRVAQFVQELRLRLPSNQSNQPSPDGSGCNHNDPNCTHHPEDREDSDTTPTQGTDDYHRSLPFEFQALEACLEAACNQLDSEACTLAEHAQNALDDLALHVSATNLEIVRHIKNRLVQITGRVHRVRDELEQLLDDDGDMAEMYLTAKLTEETCNESPASNISREDASSEDSLEQGHGINSTDDHVSAQHPSSPDHPTSTDHPSSSPDHPTSMDHPLSRDHPLSQVHTVRPQKRWYSPSKRSPPRIDDHSKQKDLGSSPPHILALPPTKRTHKTEHIKLVALHDNNEKLLQRRGSSRMSSVNLRDVEDLECLLEAYFVLIDRIVHHVASVKESVDDTEDYVKIMLDDHQNKLLKLNIILAVLCLVISCFIALTGMFGMNIDIPLYEPGTSLRFWKVVAWSSTGSIFLSAIILGWCKYYDFI